MDDILLQKPVEELKEKSKDGEYTIKASLYEKDRDKEDGRGDALDAKIPRGGPQNANPRV